MYIVIINGRPTVGKDEFVLQCRAIIPTVFNISTVDFVKHLATECGWDGTKTAANRKFLSDLKDLLTQWNDVPFKKIENELLLYARRMESYDIPEYQQIAFVHCREPQEIQKFVDRLGACSLLITRPGVDGHEQYNHADTEVENYHYDFTIANDGTIEDLYNKAKEFLTVLTGH